MKFILQKILSELQRGLGLNHLQNENIKDMEIKIPSLETQKNICNIIKKYSEKIEYLEECEEEYEEDIKLTMKMLFGISLDEEEEELGEREEEENEE